MASGQTLVVFHALHHEPPASNYATLDSRNAHAVLDFDASTDEAAVFRGIMPRNYAGNGLTATVIWAASTAVSGNCRWQGAFERLEAGGTDLDTDSFATAQSAGDTPPVSSSGQLKYTTITFTNAQIDGLLAGEAFRFKLNRDADGTSGTDDMSGDAELVGIEIRET